MSNLPPYHSSSRQIPLRGHPTPVLVQPTHAVGGVPRRHPPAIAAQSASFPTSVRDMVISLANGSAPPGTADAVRPITPEPWSVVDSPAVSGGTSCTHSRARERQTFVRCSRKADWVCIEGAIGACRGACHRRCCSHAHWACGVRRPQPSPSPRGRAAPPRRPSHLVQPRKMWYNAACRTGCSGHRACRS